MESDFMEEKTMQRLELEMGVHNLESNMDLIIKSAKLHAEIRRAKFDSLVQKGFSEQQALQIVIHTKPIE
jgi:hypothetical protein